MFSCETCKILKNACLEEHLRMITSVFSYYAILYISLFNKFTFEIKKAEKAGGLQKTS